MADKDRDNPLPGRPPTDKEGNLKVDAAAERATEKAEEKALERGGTPVPNVPVEGIRESLPVSGTRPAGEDRPSVEVPTHAPPEQAGPVIGVPVQNLPPNQSAAAKRLLKAEQRLDWLISHQPVVVAGQVASLRAMKARLHAERYQDKPDAGLAEAAENLLLPFGAALAPHFEEKD